MQLNINFLDIFSDYFIFKFGPNDKFSANGILKFSRLYFYFCEKLHPVWVTATVLRGGLWESGTLLEFWNDNIYFFFSKWSEHNILGVGLSWLFRLMFIFFKLAFIKQCLSKCHNLIYWNTKEYCHLGETSPSLFQHIAHIHYGNILGIDYKFTEHIDT